MHLKQLTSVTTGFPFRKRIIHDPDGKYAVIQISDIRDYRQINTQNLVKTGEINPKTHHFIQKNDVLLIAKGANNHAIHVQQQLQDTIAVSNFLVIRIKSPKLLPEYLAWYINQKEAQVYFKSKASGSYIPAVTKKMLLDLDVPLPDIQTQTQTITLQKLLDKEWQLINKIYNLRSVLAEDRLLKLSHGR